MFGDWLLCDFHVHTRYSDGSLRLPEVVDLYGGKCFDVVAVTDHIFDSKTSEGFTSSGRDLPGLTSRSFDGYLRAVWKEAERAWEQYEMLLIPGCEITNDTRHYHVLAIDIKEYMDPDLGVEELIDAIHGQGGIAVACHPYFRNHIESQQSKYLWENHEHFATMFDAWEVANRDDLFNVVGLKKFNYIANSDFHQLRHLYSWKTLLRCQKNPQAIKKAVRDNNAVSIYLLREEKPLDGRPVERKTPKAIE
ncbi:phosphotransferase [Candidatus Fermentibacteria bacterium]|nr:phosphotransferase [Candidatus Fermentibacteria bacterium]